MDNYITLYVHFVWTTKHREAVLHKDARYKLFAHIKIEAAKKGIVICIINGVADHVHCLVALTSTQSVSGIAKLIKGESSHWINTEKLIEGEFARQDGYGALSVSPPDVSRITRYNIFNQERHHADRTLDEELQKFASYASELA